MVTNNGKNLGLLGNREWMILLFSVYDTVYEAFVIVWVLLWYHIIPKRCRPKIDVALPPTLRGFCEQSRLCRVIVGAK